MVERPRSQPRAAFAATTNEEAKKARPMDQGKARAVEEVLSGSPIYQRTLAPRSLDGEPKHIAGGGWTMVQSSRRSHDDRLHDNSRGLVGAIVTAYNAHHELVLRPDDVWQAILTQLSFYVQKNAEQLRDRFVDFQGKQQLEVQAVGDLFSVDFGRMAGRIVEQITTKIKDPSVAKWLVPSFSTTTDTDRVVASVTLMATLQAYFEYKIELGCGLPRVTLLGSIGDWQVLREKIDRLPEFDLEANLMSKWHRLLRPVLDDLVSSARGNPSMPFWDTVCSHISGGSGPTYLSGWVTVFAVFTDKGVWQGDRRGLTAELPWPKINFRDIPVATVSVPVLIDDNGVEYDSHMLAGQFGYDASGSVIQPRSDWCIVAQARSPFRDQRRR